MEINMTTKRLKLFVKRHAEISCYINGSFWRDTYKRIKQFIDHNDIVLDVGSFHAPYTKYLPNTVVGIDLPSNGRFGFSKDLLEEIRVKTSFIPIIASAEALPFRSNFFDKIVCTEVLEHIPNDKSAVSEMARVLRNEGKIFLTTPNGGAIPLKYGIREHLRHYSENDLRNLLNDFLNKVIILNRFRFFNFLNLQYGLKDSWNKNRLNIPLFLTSLFVSWVYDVISYLLEKFSKGSYLNLVAICSKQCETS